MQNETLKAESMLSTGDLTIGYSSRSGKSVLHTGLNLKLYESDFVCLIGPNGCGKSTLIRTLGGLQTPLGGTITVRDKKLSNLSNTERSRLITTVLTDRIAAEHITVEEIVALGRYTYTNWFGGLSGQDKNHVRHAIQKTGLSGYGERKLSTISDGERQRAFIAKALASDAPVFLLDEPTAHLDVSNRVEILTLLRNLTISSGNTCLVSTHDLDLALQLADEIWLMLPKKGVICCTPEEIIRQNYLDKVFGNKTLFFNAESGNFALRKKTLHTIQIKENSSIPDYALKSFERLGFSLNNEVKPLAQIGVDTEGWSVSADNNEFKTLTLSEACRVLKKLASMEKQNP